MVFSRVIIFFTIQLVGWASIAGNVCERTPQVRDEIVKKIRLPCEKITNSNLATITTLDLSEPTPISRTEKSVV